MKNKNVASNNDTSGYDARLRLLEKENNLNKYMKICGENEMKIKKLDKKISLFIAISLINVILISITYITLIN